MRHHLTFMAFVVKLLCIGFVYLISISFCAAQETGQENVAELIDKLFSDEGEISHSAVQPLAPARGEDSTTFGRKGEKEGERFLQGADGL